MTRWFDLAPADDHFLERAPVRTRQVLDTPVQVDDLWAALEADDAVRAWSPLVPRSSWPRPHGVGSVREVNVAGFLTIHERFYRWDERERMTFAATHASRPGIRRFAEDYVVSPTPAGSRLVWTVAMEPAHRVPHSLAGLAGTALGLAVARLAAGLGSHLGT